MDKSEFGHSGLTLHLSCRAYRHAGVKLKTLSVMPVAAGKLTLQTPAILLRDRDTLLSRGRFCLRETCNRAYCLYLQFRFLINVLEFSNIRIPIKNEIQWIHREKNDCNYYNLIIIYNYVLANYIFIVVLIMQIIAVSYYYINNKRMLRKIFTIVKIVIAFII